MRHRKAGRALGRNSSHRRALYRSLVTSLLEHERIETTVRARLGDWVELGGVFVEGERRDAGIASVRSRGMRESRGIRVKVEELRP